MTKLHVTTSVNFGYKPKDVGRSITEENTDDDLDGLDVYMTGVVKAFANYTGILMANGKHITLHYGDTTTLPEGFSFDKIAVVKVVGVSTSKAGSCLVVELLVFGEESITEQV